MAKWGEMGGNGGKWGKVGGNGGACACAYASPFAEGSGNGGKWEIVADCLKYIVGNVLRNV